MTNADRVRRLFEDGWNGGRFEAVADDTAPSITFHYNGATSETTPEDLPRLVAMWRSGFPDLHMDLRHVIEQGDLVAVSLVLRGTHEGPWRGIDGTGRTVAVEEMMFFRFADGVVVEMWEVFDEQGLFAQISR
mgnify:CR=1 FL=1